MDSKLNKFFWGVDSLASKYMCFVSNWSWAMYLAVAVAATACVNQYGWGLEYGGWADQFGKLSLFVFGTCLGAGIVNIFSFTAVLLTSGHFEALGKVKSLDVKISGVAVTFTLWIGTVITFLVLSTLPGSIWLLRKLRPKGIFE